MRMVASRREFLHAAAGMAVTTSLCARTSTTRSFWVFGLLRPTSVNVRASGTARLHCTAGDRKWIVEGGESLCFAKGESHLRITGPGGGPVDCLLEVPGVIRRSYFAALDIFGDGEFVLPVLTMDSETATGSIVGAELPVDETPLAGSAAQAVVSRSIFVAETQRHRFADFCDTTHCQFLRSPVAAASPVGRAVAQTAGIVLSQSNEILPPRYSAACGGKTEAGINCGQRYSSVLCEICRDRGTSRRGHGWGLCQEGAMGFAERGWPWHAILRKYYPDAICLDALPTMRRDQLW